MFKEFHRVLQYFLSVLCFNGIKDNLLKSQCVFLFALNIPIDQVPHAWPKGIYRFHGNHDNRVAGLLISGSKRRGTSMIWLIWTFPHIASMMNHIKEEIHLNNSFLDHR